MYTTPSATALPNGAYVYGSLLVVKFTCHKSFPLEADNAYMTPVLYCPSVNPDEKTVPLAITGEAHGEDVSDADAHPGAPVFASNVCTPPNSPPATKTTPSLTAGEVSEHPGFDAFHTAAPVAASNACRPVVGSRAVAMCASEYVRLRVCASVHMDVVLVDVVVVVVVDEEEDDVKKVENDSIHASMSVSVTCSHRRSLAR
jgi:hypothetical protein